MRWRISGDGYDTMARRAKPGIQKKSVRMNLFS
jgi:hypothetical protein